MSNLAIRFIASLGAGLATVLGALPILLPINLTQRVKGMMLGFGGGVMLAATSFSLVIPETEAAISQGTSKFTAAGISDEIIPESHRQGLEKAGTIGVMIGFVVMMFLDIALG